LEKDYEEVGAESSDGKDDDDEYWMIAVLFFLLCHLWWWNCRGRHGVLVRGPWIKCCLILGLDFKTHQPRSYWKVIHPRLQIIL
jgi:hypothetical protein